MDKVERQIAAEVARKNRAEEFGKEMTQRAIEQGRYSELPAGRVVLARAHELAVELLKAVLETKTRGIGGKYRNLLRQIDPSVAVMTALKIMLSSSRPGEFSMSTQVQSALTSIGRAIEAEVMISAIDKAAAPYLNRTLEYLDAGHTKSLLHRYRTLKVAADRTIGDWEPWPSEERTGVAAILFRIAMESGLFQTVDVPHKGGKLYKHLQPSEELLQHYEVLANSAKALLTPEPMTVPPLPWDSYASGGYYTPWMQAQCPAVRVVAGNREQREWVIENFNKARGLREAMNKAQSVAYRVNKRVFDIFQQALAVPEGILGLPMHGEVGQPAFPFPEGWDKAKATPEELDEFKDWKSAMAQHYAVAGRRTSKKNALAHAARMFRHFMNEEGLYFVTYLDSRGRMYFRGAVNPHGSDAVKGCLEFAHGAPLGERGLFWLKAHVAACAGFDKADFHLRVQWTDENWGRILAWLEDPLSSDPDEPETAFTFLAAALALKEALLQADPTQYVCHIPVAMDATCSGLQHFSALQRDPLGGKHTNLIDADGDQKSDIYAKVGELAMQTVRFPDANYAEFWAERPISRSMAKRPTMTYCYSATLISNIDYVVEALLDEGAEPIRDAAGKCILSLNKLAVPVAKALRAGVERTVPAAAAIMRHLQRLVAVTDGPLRWITPAGMPVLNWTPEEVLKALKLRALGVNEVLLRHRTSRYDNRPARSSVAPNFVHSMDSAHLCRVLLKAPFEIWPIHDSFACLPNNVEAMHSILRDEFVAMYEEGDPLAMLEQGELLEGKERPDRPAAGALDLTNIRSSRFCFC
jgi:DNA-directed RNA polymerase